MGQMYKKGADGLWKPAAPYARTSTGWKKSGKYYRKSGSTWALLWEVDTTPPAAPTVTSLVNDPNTKKLTLIVRTAADADTSAMDVRMSITAYPTDNKTPAQAFSGSTKTVAKSTSYTFVMPYTKTNTTYYFSAFVKDALGNVSARAIKSLKVPTPVSPVPTPPPTKPVVPGTPAPPPPPAPSPTAPTVYKATISTTASASWTNDYDKWYPNVTQGGLNDYKGCWFFGTRLTNVLKVARKIRKMTIRVQRLSSTHGVSGEANVLLVMHERSSASGAPVFSNTVKIGTLSRGEAGTFPVPVEWWDNMQKSTYWKGFGLRGGDISYSSANYMVAYGFGTRSGEVYIEYEK